MITFVDGAFLSMPWSARLLLLLFMFCNVCLEILSGTELIKQNLRAEAVRSKVHPAITVSSALLDPTSRPLCSRQQVQDGEWHPVTLSQALYIPPNNHKLLCDRFQIQRYEQGNVASWKWKPREETCELVPWDRDQFCTLMHRQKILFMGDSLTQEASFSFGELMGLRTSDGDGQPGGFPAYNLEGACNGTVEATFRRADFLKPYNVAQELQEKFPDVVVLNRGAHYVGDDELMRDMNETIAHIGAWQSRCTEAGKRCLLVWRTTVPGHPGCSSTSQPMTNRTAVERLINDDYSSGKFKWALFQHQNELIANALSTSGIDFEMMDAYHINILRPDGHRIGFHDCLHNCLNSKLDVYSQLLLHILRRREWGNGNDRL